VPRKSRREEPGAAHHGFPRGANRAEIFRDDGDRQTFLVILKGVIETYGWRLLAYCLMRNHFHLVVETPLPNFGRGMQRLLSTYAAYYNRRYDRPGHVFNRPFKSERIKDEHQLAVAVEYVALNPVRAGLCTEPGDWRWSSHGTQTDVHRAAVLGAVGFEPTTSRV
jgi:REP element-mobilizing transposase RayT